MKLAGILVAIGQKTQLCTNRMKTAGILDPIGQKKTENKTLYTHIMKLAGILVAIGQKQ